MSMMYPEAKGFFLLFSFIVILLLQVLDHTDANDNFFRAEDTGMKDDIEMYLQALERFDRTNTSCDALTSSIKNFFKFIDYRRKYELASFLFTFPKMRRGVFPEVKYNKIYRAERSKVKIVDVIIRTADGTLFAICVGHPAGDAVEEMRKIGKSGDKSYRGIKGEVRHVVGVDLAWSKNKPGGKDILISTTYLCDVMDYSRAINVNVTLALSNPL